MTITRRFIAAFAAVVAVTVTAVPAQSATLRWAAQNDIVTLDPHSQNHTTTHTVLQHAYEGLVRFDKQFQVEPCLATSWRQISPTQLRFNLRKGVKFHDGSVFTADDVVFSYGRIMQPQGSNQMYVAGVKEVKKIDDYTVDFILSDPNPVLLRLLPMFRIMSKTWAAKNRSEKIQDFKAREENYASRHANGTGPYMIKQWEPDKRVVMSANPAWWDKTEGNATEVIYLPIKSDATRMAALLSGEVDLVTDIPTQDVTRLKGDPRLKVLEGVEARSIYIGLDVYSPELKYSNVKGKNPFTDIRVRKALNLAVDREAIRRVTMRGLSIPAVLVVPPGVTGHSVEIDKVTPVDVDGAKKLLAEAGYPNGFEFGLDCPNNRYVNDEEICQALVGLWAKAGLKVRLTAQPMATYFVKIQNFDHSAYMLGFAAAAFDAETSLQAIAHTKTTGADGSFNFGRISDPKLDALIDAGKTEMDAKRREALLRDALVRVRDNFYFVPLHHQMHPWAMKKNVSAVHNAYDMQDSRFARVE